MFTRGLRALQRFGESTRASRGPPGRGTGSAQAFRGFYSSAVGGMGSTGMRLAGGGLLTGGGVLAYNQSQGKQPLAPFSGEPAPAWLHSIEQRCQEVLSPGQMLRQHFLGRLVVEQDHLFTTMIQSGQISTLRCFYEKAAKNFHTVVSVGKNVAGYPGVMHGGLTAALMDETFGGLSVSIWQSGGFGIQAPGYTARLEVDYKQKIPAGSTILCTTELESTEGRKMWMRAQVSDGKSTVYATGRALFVAPKMPGSSVVSHVISRVNSSGIFIAGMVPGLGGKKSRPSQ